MKEIQIKKFFAGAAAMITVFANVALLAVPSTAQAACSYTINLNGDRRSVTSNGQVTLNISGTTVGDSSSCAKKVQVDFGYKNNKNGITLTLGTSDIFDIIDGKFSGSYKVDLSSKYSSIKNNLVNPNLIEFIAHAQFFGNEQIIPSNFFAVTVSNTQVQGDSMRVNLVPSKGEYTANDAIVFDIQGLSTPQSEQEIMKKNVFVEIWVNNKSIYSKTIGGGEYLTTFRSPGISVNIQNNFGNGTNTVRVEAWQAGTQLRLGRVTASFGVKGLSASAPATPDKSDASDVLTRPGAGAGAGSGAGGVSPRLDERLFNPLPTDSLTGTVLTVAKGFLAIVALWAVTFIIIGAFKLTMAQGNEEAYIAAKKTIVWAVLGMVVAMLSFSIIAIVQSVLQISVPPVPTNNSSKEGDQPVKNLNN